MNKNITRIKKALIVLLAVFVAAGIVLIPDTTAQKVCAAFSASYLNLPGDGTRAIDAADREAAYGYLIDYKKNLINKNDLSQETKQRLEDVWYQANVYIANYNMNVNQLVDYVNTTVENFDNVARDDNKYTDTEDFLFINNNSLVTSASYGQLTTLTLSLINVGKVDVTNVVISPKESNDILKWPFDITTASNVLIIPKIKASEDIHTAHSYAQDATWFFYVSKDAKTGTYPLTFDVQYYRGEAMVSTEITTYIHINGAPGAGNLVEEEKKDNKDEKTSTPRIIVTGFKTNPEAVYAGDTFMLTISLQNTSTATAVSNIQFDLKAPKEGKDEEVTYEAFLPTSGSATIFVPYIGAGNTTSISIEMTAKSDLAQKPYVINLTAVYEDEKKNPYEMSSNISIPVKQESRIDTGDYEILPDSVAVGESANITFPVYNKGKTILYNVQVEFVGDTVEGGSTFLGKLEPGKTGNVDAMITGASPTMDDGIIKAVISYEDEAGNVTSIEKEISFFVSEPYYDEGGDDQYFSDGELPEEEKESGVYWKPIIIVVASLAAVGIVVGAVIAHNRKKKRMREYYDDEDI